MNKDNNEARIKKKTNKPSSQLTTAFWKKIENGGAKTNYAVEDFRK